MAKYYFADKAEQCDDLFDYGKCHLGEDRWLTTEEVAKRYPHVSASTVRYWRMMGTGPAGVKIGRKVTSLSGPRTR